MEPAEVLRKRILWKLDWHILPCLTLLWLVNFLDRSNIGNARIAGLERDLHLQGNQFNIALSAFFISYLLMDIPASLFLKRLRADRWIPMMVFAWGFTTVMTCFVKTFSGLVIVRFFLGFCEGGLLPCMLLYLSTMYPRRNLQMRIGIFYAGASLSGAFGGLLATAIIKMDDLGGLAGWRWIFILEGLATMVIGLIAAYTLPADLASAGFLTDDEKKYAAQHFAHFSIVPVSLENNANDTKQDASEEMLPTLESNHQTEIFEFGEVRRGLHDVQAWLTGIATLAFIVTLYSYSLFLEVAISPTIIAGLGYSGEEAQLRTVPPYVPAAFLTILVAYWSDRLRLRVPFLLLCLPLAITGFILAILAGNNKVRYAAVFLIAAGTYPCSAGILTIIPDNMSGHYKRATSIGLQIALANCGGFVSTFVYTSDQQPRYIKGHSVALSFMCLAWILLLFNMLYCMYENKARREGRRRSNLTRYQELWGEGKTKAPIGDRHPDFRFVL